MNADRERFAALFDVSRETFGRLDTYASLLAKWNAKINLVSPSTLPHLWERHFVDSAQILKLAPNSGQWLDIGSGAGFPGMVCAIMAAETSPDLAVSFVESDQRKCAFLETVLRELGLVATVHSARIEALEPTQANILTARALAPLPDLLAFAERHLAEDGLCLFPKGARVEDEITKSLETWAFDVTKHPSETDPAGTILAIGSITRV